jgi:hypothetical protein
MFYGQLSICLYDDVLTFPHGPVLHFPFRLQRVEQILLLSGAGLRHSDASSSSAVERSPASEGTHLTTLVSYPILFSQVELHFSQSPVYQTPHAFVLKGLESLHLPEGQLTSLVRIAVFDDRKQSPQGPVFHWWFPPRLDSTEFRELLPPDPLTRARLITGSSAIELLLCSMLFWFLLLRLMWS